MVRLFERLQQFLFREEMSDESLTEFKSLVFEMARAKWGVDESNCMLVDILVTRRDIYERHTHFPVKCLYSLEKKDEIIEALQDAHLNLRIHAEVVDTLMRMLWRATRDERNRPGDEE